ncbi:MAG: glycosyltransferase family 2 protein [Pseudomonadota bacterium]
MLQEAGYRSFDAAPSAKPELTIVVPAYNESASLPPFFARLLPVLRGLGRSFEVLVVDDGSRDATPAVLAQLHDDDGRIGTLRLSRNFGKEAAMSAGLDHARGAAVVLIDADLQQPPEVIPQLVAAWDAGAQVVHAQESTRPPERLLARLGAKLFYRLFNRMADVRLPTGIGDYCLLDRQAVDALGRLPERSRFMKGLYFWIGFRREQVHYERDARRRGGSRWSYRRLGGLALDGLTAFSTMPLRLASLAGMLVSALALGYALVIVTNVLFFGVDVPGYPSIMVTLLFLGGVQLIGLGILGEYVGRIYEEIKQRPLYLIAEATLPVDLTLATAPVREAVGEPLGGNERPVHVDGRRTA